MFLNEKSNEHERILNQLMSLSHEHSSQSKDKMVLETFKAMNSQLESFGRCSWNKASVEQLLEIKKKVEAYRRHVYSLRLDVPKQIEVRFDFILNKLDKQIGTKAESETLINFERNELSALGNIPTSETEMLPPQIVNRPKIDLHNGVACNASSISASIEVDEAVIQGEKCPTIKSSLPLFTLYHCVHASRNMCVHKVSGGYIHAYCGHYNMHFDKDRKAAKIAVRLAVAKGWNKIIVWGKLDFIVDVIKFANKADIPVQQFNGSNLRAVEMFNTVKHSTITNPALASKGHVSSVGKSSLFLLKHSEGRL
ncbi:hypothetical protein TUMSATVNIG1_60980 (plasmid) [Vibrio nigripulchritudo]|uniref:hypothetical protein n=1 Tax=Vibrio nigripulchritudo TaxID=28173 RepID=UPI00190DD0B6|nr:hypothetical protein [Vibrio nigripulchritudo]BCL74114.1 hypothetical protein VNTUMSATTG_60510 [Vibrio nigripulchritudo]BDU35489.1 hypothetical protein TUMSATVNIG1_60980 [Vibrio nigripulchritudo]